jgi:predicted RNA-binding Zn-ribbon protein involved in translation (DUF1610 family)
MYLADLVLAALMCGLVVNLFTSGRNPSDAWTVVSLIVVVAMVWTIFRQMRRAPTCEECGRRFIQPKKRVEPSCCPHCGREQLGRPQSLRRLNHVFWGLFALLGLLVVGMNVLSSLLASTPIESAGVLGGLTLIGESILALLTIPALIGIGIYRTALKSSKERPCESCGRIIPLEGTAGPKICPRCRLRHLRPAEAKKERAQGFAILLVLFGLGALFVAWPHVGSGGDSWLGILRRILFFVASGFAGLVGFIAVLWILRRRRLKSERATVAMARKSTGRDGEVVKDGPMTVWYSGPDDPVPMLRKQLETASHRFATMTGEAPTEPPHRVLVFHDRAAFVRFHQRVAFGVDLTSFDGFHLGHPCHLATLCAAPTTGRIADPERIFRSLAGYALLDSTWGPGAPAWLQSGFSRAVSNGDDRDTLARLNRKLMAALARDTALGVEVFTMTLNGLTRLARVSREPRQSRKFYQFHYQAWSMLVYLSGDSAAHEPPKPLGAFLRDPRSKRDQESSFREQFGRGFGPFLDDWRHWVLDLGIGAHEPPPDHIRDGLLERVLPIIRDRGAKRCDRIASIRDWASCGVVLGADALIDLLGDPGDIPKEEIAWALSMVSGLDLGDDPQRWQAWWDELPLEWEEPREPAASSAPTCAVEPGAVALDRPSEVGATRD